MEGHDEVSAREQHFHSQVRETTVRVPDRFPAQASALSPWPAPTTGHLASLPSHCTCAAPRSVFPAFRHGRAGVIGNEGPGGQRDPGARGSEDRRSEGSRQGPG